MNYLLTYNLEQISVKLKLRLAPQKNKQNSDYKYGLLLIVKMNKYLKSNYYIPKYILRLSGNNFAHTPMKKCRLYINQKMKIMNVLDFLK